MVKKAAKKRKKTKVKRTAFPLMDLPTELIEDICEILKTQNLQKSLASLNVGNKFLREVTSRYLWESVRWTPRSFKACFTKVTPLFAHVKYIMLVSPEDSPDPYASPIATSSKRVTQRPFSDMADPPEFVAERLNMRTFDEILTAVNNVIAKSPVTGKREYDHSPVYKVIGGFDPFRSVALIKLAGVVISLHLVTNSKPETLRNKMTGKIVDMFALLRRLLTEDQVTYHHPRLTMSLDIDFSFREFPRNVRFFDRLMRWREALSRHPVIPSQGKVADIPFDLYVMMPEQFTHSQFKSNSFAFHDLIASLYGESPNGINLRLPISVVIHGFEDIHRPIDSMFARMDFTSAEASKVLCFGEFDSSSSTYQVTEYYQDGQEVLDDGLSSKLEQLFM